MFHGSFILSLLTCCLSSFLTLNANNYQSINLFLEDCEKFPGSFSLAPMEVYLALKHATYEDKFNVLEFGAGQGTIRLVELLNNKGIDFTYNSFENSPEYLLKIPNVTFHYYNLPWCEWGTMEKWRPYVQAVQMIKLPTADLVIVDGPHGVSRADWYPKFKEFTREGTIILIDDFHHYREFGQALNENFVYETILEYHYNYVNEGLEHIDGDVGKCFKIVKVLSKLP